MSFNNHKNSLQKFSIVKHAKSVLSKELISLTILFFILSISFASADIVEGGVFDYELNSIENVTVEIKNIDTGLLQIIETNNGIYRFSLEAGEYQIYAYNNKYSVEERLDINGGGKHIFDLFLYPNWEKEDTIWEKINDLESNILLTDSKESISSGILSSIMGNSGNTAKDEFYSNLVFIVLAALAFIIIRKHFSRSKGKGRKISFWKKKHKKEEDKNKEKVETETETVNENTSESILNSKPIVEEDLIDEDILNEIESENKENDSVLEAISSNNSIDYVESVKTIESIKTTVENEGLEIVKEELVVEPVIERDPNSIKINADEITRSVLEKPVKRGRGRPKKSETPKIDKSEISENQKDNPKYTEQMVRIIRANGGNITLLKLINEMSHISEEKVKALLNGLEFQEKVITSKKGSARKIILK